MLKKTGIIFIAVAILTFGLWGCSDIPGEYTITQGIAPSPVTVFGKVIDAQTRQGVGGATVYLKVKGSWKSTTTTSSTVIGEDEGAGDSTSGDFNFTGLPVSTTMPIIIKGPDTASYLQQTGSITTNDYSANSNGINSVVSQDLGQIAMEQGITATVHVVDASTGAYVTATDSAGTALPIPIYLGFGAANSVEDVLATQDTTDTNKYTIVIPQGGTTTLTVPAMDTDGDGERDYQSGTATISGTGDGDLTTNIALNLITSSTALGVVASNVQNIGANSGGTALNMLGKDDAVKLFYNVPIELPTTGADGVTMTYTDDFATLTAAAVLAETAVTAALSTDSTLLTITPAAALTENQSYSIRGAVRSVAETNTPNDEVAELAVNLTVYATGTGTIGSTPTITVDNFNFCTGGIEIDSASTACGTNTIATTNAYVVFPEIVWGDIRLVKTITGAADTETLYNTAAAQLTGQAITYWSKLAWNDADLAFNNAGANSSGALYRYDLNAVLALPAMSDHVAASSSKVNLGFDVYDSEGNTYRDEVTFSVE
jgi:hypothetical protein